MTASRWARCGRVAGAESATPRPAERGEPGRRELRPSHPGIGHPHRARVFRMRLHPRTFRWRRGVRTLGLIAVDVGSIVTQPTSIDGRYKPLGAGGDVPTDENF